MLSPFLLAPLCTLSLGLLLLLKKLWQPLNLPVLKQLAVRLLLALPCRIINNTNLDDLVAWEPLAFAPDGGAAVAAEEGGYAFAGVGDLVEFHWGSYIDCQYEDFGISLRFLIMTSRERDAYQKPT